MRLVVAGVPQPRDTNGTNCGAGSGAPSHSRSAPELPSPRRSAIGRRPECSWSSARSRREGRPSSPSRRRGHCGSSQLRVILYGGPTWIAIVFDGVEQWSERGEQVTSDDLMHSLLEHDLIDEYQLLIHPVVLGRGRSFFKDGVERMALDLVDTTVIPAGVAILTYQPQRVNRPRRRHASRDAVREANRGQRCYQLAVPFRAMRERASAEPCCLPRRASACRT